MNILIIEDETAAARQLQQLIKEIILSGSIVATIESVREAVSWFGNNTHPDLIITDIQLADGTCFEIFSQVTIQAPVIFTTAYDAFMQQAFKTNSIDYLLKPIDRTELQTALFKYQEIQNRTKHFIQEKVLSLLSRNLLHPKSYKTRFLVKNGDRYFTIPASEIAYLSAEDRIVFLHNNQGQKYIIDESLDELEKQLDPAIFYRLNRQYIAPIASIEKIQNHFNGRLWIQLKHSADKEVFVSREKAGSFKQWLDGK